jgi:hypothetical protein
MSIFRRMCTWPTNQLTDIQILEHSCAEKCDVSRANVNRSPDMGDISQMFEEKSRRGDSGVKEGALSFE